jgi:hypothetical protein
MQFETETRYAMEKSEYAQTDPMEKLILPDKMDRTEYSDGKQSTEETLDAPISIIQQIVRDSRVKKHTPLSALLNIVLCDDCKLFR